MECPGSASGWHAWIPSYRHLLGLNRRWIAAATVIFLLGLFAGFVAAHMSPDAMIRASAPLVDRLESLAEQVIETNDPLERSVIIFFNNARASIVLLLFGPVFGLGPLISLFINGSLIGLLFGLTTGISQPEMTSLAGYSAFAFLALLPHGVVEIPALLLIGAWGLKLGIAPWLPSAAGARSVVLQITARESMQILALVIALLFLAAMIEANVTLTFAQWLQDHIPSYM